jgi:N-acetylglucosamine kinase-like BadF-type ATPase
MTVKYTIGLDMGGTATRALLVDTDGQPAGRGRSGGGNPVTHGVPAAVSAFTEALRQALEGIDPARVRAGCAGVAGYSLLLADPAARESFEAAWRAVGTGGPLRLTYDIDAAYASGTARPDGLALIAGTGAVAAQIRRHRTVRTAGGRGWLLGDEGSAFWIGREAVRSLLDLAERRPDAPDGELAELLRRQLALDRGAEKAAVIAAVTREPPIGLARLAPLVSAAARKDDPAARAIVARTARHLAELAEQAAAGNGGGGTGGAGEAGEAPLPIILSGSVLSPGEPVAQALHGELTDRLPGAEVSFSGEGVRGAAWLAAVEASAPHPESATELHRLITGANR